MPSKDVKTGLHFVERGQKLVNVIKNEIVFELGYEHRAGVRVQKFYNFARFIELFLNHEAADDLSYALATELPNSSIDGTGWGGPWLTVLAIPRTVSVEYSPIVEKLLLVGLIGMKLGKVFPCNSSGSACIF